MLFKISIWLSDDVSKSVVEMAKSADPSQNGFQVKPAA